MLEAGEPSHKTMPFEQHQALAAAPAFFHKQIDSCTADPVRMALIGAGGCTIPMALRGVMGKRVVQDVVELEPAVLQVAQNFFGAVEEPEHMRFHAQDGVVYLENCPDGSLEVLMLDPAHSQASDIQDDPDGLEIPPAAFVQRDFVEGQLRRCLSDEGVCVCNVIAGRNKLVEMIRTWENVFGAVYVLATDPNYFFWGFAQPKVVSPTSFVATLQSIPALAAMCVDVEKLVLGTEEHLEDGTLLGWVTVDQFVDMCHDKDVVI
mmetsp:Transcript_9513/g.17874  ORF Transcript_9513/g.17874 Transcript_9513/m.17874 type:complete len:263 (+) Transcript_9513:919-1707(+)